MKPLIPPLCDTCVHFSPDFTCKAFPAGIPDEIVFSLVDHRIPFRDDGGVTYEFDKKKQRPLVDPIEFVDEIESEEGDD